MARLNFKTNGCHKVKLKVKKTLGPRSFRLEVKLTNLAGQVRSMSGLFRSERTRPMDSISPGVYGPYLVEFLNNNREKLFWVRAVLDNIFQFPARGYIEGNSYKLGARIGMDKGLSLELFFPSLNRWWIVK